MTGGVNVILFAKYRRNGQIVFMAANRVGCELHKSVARIAYCALVAIAHFSLFALASSPALAGDL